VVVRQPYAPAAFTSGEIPGTHFYRLSRPHSTRFRRQLPKKSPVTPLGINPVTVLNHYATLGALFLILPYVNNENGLTATYFKIPAPNRKSLKGNEEKV